MGYKDYELVIDQTQAEDVNYEADIINHSGVCIQTQWSGTVLGVLKLKGRNHADLNWQEITQVPFTQPAGAPGGELFIIGNLLPKFIQINFDFTSGVGSFQVAMIAKDTK